MAYTHLQVRSSYSLLNSTITIEKLVKQAMELEYRALALTDEQVLHGAISFYQECLKYSIKPIIGMTVFVKRNQTEIEELTLLAKTNEGYHNLAKLSTWIQKQDEQFIPLDNLKNYTAHCIGILSVHQSPIADWFMTEAFTRLTEYLLPYQEAFAEADFYLGVEAYGMKTELPLHEAVKLFQKTFLISVVAIHDVRYIQENDVIAYDCLQAMKHNQQWDGDQISPLLKNHHLRSKVEMKLSFSAWSEPLQTTEEIVQKCEVKFDFQQRFLPSFPLTGGKDSHDYLVQKCHDLLSNKYAKITNEIQGRLNYELEVIKTMQFSDYFLIVADFIAYAKNNGIVVGPGRGSAAGSLVAYVLGITDVDPIRYELLFERFLNPERMTMPDIDVDFSDIRREEVIEYVQKTYGEEHVAQIITFGTFAARSLMRELIKTMDINQQDASFILRHIPLQTKKSLVQIISESEELKSYIKDSKTLRRLFTVATKLEGIPKHLSTHAAGIVITEQPLEEHVPLIPGSSSAQLTQYAMNDIEAIGLLKIDLLGLRNLTLLERVLQRIRYTTGKALSLEQIPDDDSLTFSLLQKGKTNGVFQLESQGMRQVLQELKPSHFEDIVAVNALYRPGPMDYISTYIHRKHGLETVTYPHSDLAPILSKTYGVLVYQEQIMQIAHQIAGFTLGQADILRRAVSKKQENMMEQQKAAFISGCINNGYSESVAMQLFTWIVRFSNYGFNRSHAVAYSRISYQLAYLKAHFPAAFFAELLSSSVHQHHKLQMYLREMKELQLKLLPPSINHSFGKYAVEGNDIRMGLLQIKGIGNQAVSEIIRVRKQGPFKSLFDFCLRVSLKAVNRQTIELLIMAGTFDELYHNRASLLATIDQAIEQGELFKEFQEQPSLFQDQIELEGEYVSIEDFTQVKKLAQEKELIGIYISSHPMHEYRKVLQRSGYLSLRKVKKKGEGYRLKSAGIIQTIKTIRTKRGDPMAFLSLGDETDDMEAVVFPQLYREVRRWLKEEMMVLVEGKLEWRKQRVQMLLSAIQPLDMTALKEMQTTRLFIKLTGEDNTKDLIKLKQISSHFPGNTPVIIFQEQQRKTYQLTENYNLKPTTACIQELKDYFGTNEVVLD